MTSREPRSKATAKPPAEPEVVLGGTVAGDEQELRQQIEHTREQLGETVEQLAAKTDVKGRARAKAAGLTERVKGSTAQVRARAAERGASIRGRAAGKTVMARRKTAAADDTAKTQLRARAAPVWEAAPEPVRRIAARGVSVAKQHRVPLMAAAATMIAGYLALGWWRKR